MTAKKLTLLFNSCDISVNFLTRTYSANHVPKNTFLWNPEKNEIDMKAFDGVDTVIHLAGASIANKRWTESYKQTILNSRTLSSQFLLNCLIQSGQIAQIKKYISASAIGIYPSGKTETISEHSDLGEGFLPEVCKAWEHTAELWKNEGVSCSIVRIGLVLSNDAGLLYELLKPSKFYLYPVLGNSKYNWSWIHLEDLCKIIFELATDKLPNGTYNGVAPEISTQLNFLKTLRISQRKAFGIFPPVPGFILRLFMGERSQIILSDQKISAQKLLDNGFVYSFPTLTSALNDLCAKSN